MSNSIIIIDHPQSENDKIKPVSEIISFIEFEFEKLKKKEAVWFSLFHKSELYTAITHNLLLILMQCIKLYVKVSAIQKW